jgi:hypothetical protein
MTEAPPPTPRPPRPPITLTFPLRPPCRHEQTGQTWVKRPCEVCHKSVWPPSHRGRGEARWSPRRIEARLRALRAVELWAQGVNYAEIARHEPGYGSRFAARKAIMRLLERHPV